MEDAGNHLMYYLRDGSTGTPLGSHGPDSNMVLAGKALLSGPQSAFVSEELMLIPEDTELPPDYVQEW